MESHTNYPRTFHLPWSEAVTSDDKVVPSVVHFEGNLVVVTEKMDGENTTMYRDYVHARSLDSKGGEDRAWVKQFWASIRSEIPEGWRICGENLWAKHSVSYSNLHSYFYGFSIFDEHNRALSWEDTEDYFEMLGVTPVPVLYSGLWDETVALNLAKGLDTNTTEGYVVRLADSFHYDNFSTSVAKFVRKGHVQTDKHWRTQQLVPNSLVT
jgi:hypothetical protein